MNTAKIAFSSFAAGAACMYFSDPDRGKRRRALVRDKSAAALNSVGCLLDKARRDAANRAEGAVCTLQSVFRHGRTDDQVLAERVRSRLGRLVSHPHAIQVHCENGKIVLKGPVLEHELSDLLRGVKAVPGVRDVESHLEPHQNQEHVSSLQGGTPRESRSELMQQNWTPALRVAAGALGGSLVLYGMRSGGATGYAGGLAGAALLGRAISNRGIRDLAGVGSGPRTVSIDKTIHIQAPVEEVFSFWSDYEKLPRFMAHLKSVRDLGNGRSEWVAEGPGGVSVSWEAEITKNVPNKLLAWRSVPGSKVESEGVVRFDEDGKGGTRVSIRMCYRPPAGIIGHYVASLFGADAKSEMDDDLVRLKSLLETGKTRAHGTRVEREELRIPVVSGSNQLSLH